MQKKNPDLTIESYLIYLYLIEKTIDEICTKQQPLTMRSLEDCHRYYSCSGEDIQLNTWIEPYQLLPAKYKHECHYPWLLYSEETMQCENKPKWTLD